MIDRIFLDDESHAHYVALYNTYQGSVKRGIIDRVGARTRFAMGVAHEHYLEQSRRYFWDKAEGLLPLERDVYFKEILSLVLDGCSKKEVDVITSRVNGAKLRELGVDYGVTKERIRGIEVRALMKARHRARQLGFRTVA